MAQTVQTNDLDKLLGRVPYRIQPPTAQQIMAALTIISLAGPAMLGGMPVLPVMIEDERRRQQEQIQQVSESSVGVYQTSSEAQAGLALSQQRLAMATGEVEDLDVRDVEEQDVLHAAQRVFTGQVEKRLEQRFRSEFTHVVWDNVDLYILRESERART